MYFCSTILRKGCFILILMFVIGFAFGQPKNMLSGIVFDNTGEPLIGANVFIAGTTNGAITNIDGEFSINLPKSPFELKVSFLGYDIQSFLSENIKSGLLKVKLKPSSQTLDQIVVSGSTDGQTKALIEQQKSSNIKNIVSSEQIDKFPDMNAAEAMQRITGITVQRDQGEGKYIQLRGTPPELTNFNINGEQIPSPEGGVRYVGMDIISADQIEAIEVSKVLMPDMDGDGIAGSVNIVTKKASSEEPELTLSSAVGYNNLRGTNNYNLQLSYGARKNKLGFQMSGSYYQNEQGSDNLEAKYAKGPFWGDTTSGKDNYYLMYKELQLRYYETMRKRTGFSGTLDYEFNKNHNIYLRGMMNQFTDQQTRSRKIYALEDAIDINNYLYGGVTHDVKYRTKNQKVNTLNLGAVNDFHFIKLDYELAFAMAQEDVPDRIVTTFDNPGQALEITLDQDGSTFPKPIFQNPVHDSIAHDYANYEFDGLNLRNEVISDYNYTAKLNATLPFEISPWNKGFFRFGGKVRYKDKSREVTAKVFDDYRHDWKLYPSTRPYDELIMTDISSGYLTGDLLEQGYVVEEIPDANKMRNFYDFNAFHFKYGDKADTDTRVESTNLDYKANELNQAVYAMVNYNYKKFNMVGGLRYEYTRVDYDASTVLKNKRGYYDTIIPVNDQREHSFLLPQFQVKYSPIDRLNIRGAITYSFARPNFEDVIPNSEVDRDEISFGNPNLEYPTALNMDFMVEKYLNNDGLISGGLFYKNIDNFIFNYTVMAHLDTISNPIYEIKRAVNGKQAYVYGAEFQAQFKFTALPSFLSDMGIYSNYSFTYSDAIINQRIPANYSDLVVKVGVDSVSYFSEEGKEEHVRLPGQAMHSANLALFYDGRKFYAKLSANYHDNYLLSLGADADLDEYIASALHLDFTASYTINKYIKCFVDVINITNTPETTYLGSTDYLKKQEYYSWWGRIGIKLNY